jgi:hypothetical protein
MNKIASSLNGMMNLLFLSFFALVATSESHRTSSVDLIETIRALPMKKFG